MEFELVKKWIDIVYDFNNTLLDFLEHGRDYFDYYLQMDRKPVVKLVINLANAGMFKVAYRKWERYIEKINRPTPTYHPRRLVWRNRSSRKGSRRARRVGPHMTLEQQREIKSLFDDLVSWYRRLLLDTYNRWGQPRWSVVEQMHRGKQYAPDIYDPQLIGEVMEYMDIPVRRGFRKRSTKRKQSRRARRRKKRSR